MRVCVVGLGTIGIQAIRYIHERGLDVVGYDLDKKSIDDIETFADLKEVPKSDVYVVAVSSDNVENACRDISRKSRNSLVSIESTAQVGTCRRTSNTLGLKTLVHCPHRYWVEDPTNHGIRQPRVIGAINERSLERGLEFYNALDIPLHVCPTIETAEICKIAENAYRFVQIAFAEELRTICEEKEISFDEVRDACNTKWNIQILEARDGISGSCLPQDIGYLKSLAENSPLLNGAVLADRIYKKRRRSV